MTPTPSPARHGSRAAPARAKAPGFRPACALALARALAGALALLLSLGAPLAQAQADNSAGHTITVWASVMFGADGKATSWRFVNEAEVPPSLIANAQVLVQGATVQPPVENGAPASFRTGVRLMFVLVPTDDGALVQPGGMTTEPLPLKQFMAPFPADIRRTGGWRGSVTATCAVGVEGKCTAITVKALPGMPDSVRRYARASLDQWVFEPQQVNGRPVPGESTLTINLETLDTQPEDFRTDKFDRATVNR